LVPAEIFSKDDFRISWLLELIQQCGTTYDRYAMLYENGRMIFISKGMSTTFQKIWEDEKVFI